MKMTFALLAAALTVIASPAAANEKPSVRIDISDLNLTRQADQDKLQRRIDNTARRLCRLGGFDTGIRRVEAECRVAIMASATPQVDLAIAKARTEHFATIAIDVQG